MPVLAIAGLSRPHDAVVLANFFDGWSGATSNNRAG
jgi:hypothetical protein